MLTLAVKNKHLGINLTNMYMNYKKYALMKWKEFSGSNNQYWLSVSSSQLSSRIAGTKKKPFKNYF